MLCTASERKPTVNKNPSTKQQIWDAQRRYKYEIVIKIKIIYSSSKSFPGIISATGDAFRQNFTKTIPTQAGVSPDGWLWPPLESDWPSQNVDTIDFIMNGCSLYDVIDLFLTQSFGAYSHL